MAAQLEEVVPGSHALQPQHLGEDGGHHLLDRIPGRQVIVARPGLGLDRQPRQGAAVHLAVGRQREGVQEDERRGHHVIRQPLAHRLPENRHVQARHDVGRQRIVPLDGAGEDHGRLDPRRLAQGRLHLAQLDAEAADLHLVVEPAQELQLAVRPVAHEVAHPVHPRSRNR